MAIPSVSTDRADYAPRSTATFTAFDFSAGGKIQFQVVNLGADGLYGTPDDLLYKAWIVVDGSSADASTLAGVVETSWVVPDSARDRDLRLIAIEDTNGDGVFGGDADLRASTSFSDAAGTTNKVYQHWADGDAALGSSPSWNNNILSANKSDYFEGEVIPHVFIYKASNQAPLTKDATYSFTIAYNEYQSNTNAGGFAYLTTYDVSRAPGPLGVTSPYITPTLDATFNNGGGFTGATGLRGGSGFYTVDADVTAVSAVSPSGNGTRDGNVTVTFKYTGTTTTTGVAELYYGLFIAPPGAVAAAGQLPTDGANAWTGGSLQTTVTVGKAGATSIQLAPAAIIAGEINGTKFNDLDADAVRDTGEPGLSGWTIVLDTDTNFSNGYLKTAVTDASGFYAFSVTPDADKTLAGNNPYVVYEVQQSGWVQTTPNPAPITISTLDPYEYGVDFGNRQQLPAILLDKSAKLVTGTDGLNAGDTIVYNFIVQNTGNVALTGVVVADDPASFDLNDPADPTDGAVSNPPAIGSLAVGATATVTSTYVLTQEDLDDLYAGLQDPGSKLLDGVDNVATATGYFGAQAVTSTDSARVTGFVLDPRLELVKTGVWMDTDTDGYAELGEFIEYSFKVTNVGNVTLTNVSIADPQITVIGGPITLAVGQSDAVTFKGSHALTQADIDAGAYYNVATADSNESGPATDDEHVTLPQDPAIELLKSGSFVDGNANGQADVGELIVYTFAISNTSNVTLYDLLITDPLIQIQGGPLNLLQAGGVDTATFSGSYALIQADIDRGFVYNLATVKGHDLQGDLAQDDDEHTQSLIQNPAILLEKTGAWVDGDGDGAADVGEVVNYSFSLSNTGNVTLYGVTVTDPKVTVAGGPITLAAGAVDSATFSGSYVLTQADIDAGSVYNLALASGQDAQGDAASDSDDHMQSLIQNPAILLEKTGAWVDGDGDGAADVGEVVNYSFSLSNTGNVTLYGVTVTDPKVTVAGGPITLAAGAVDSATFSGSYVLTQADIDTGSVYNLALASGQDAQGDLAQDDDEHTQSLIQNPAILLEKTGAWVDGDGDGAADVGEVVNYSFSLSNTGNVTLYGVTVTDPKVTVAGGPITLAAGAADTGTFSGSYVLTQADIDAGSVYNLALASGQDAQGDAASDSDDHTQSLIQNPAILLEKTGAWVDGDGDGAADVGEVVNYSFSLSNTGNVTLYGVTVTDPKVTVAGGPITLAAGAADTGTFSGSYVLTQADIDAGSVYNLALASGQDARGDLAQDDDDHTQSLVQNPAILLEKTGAWVDGDGDGAADVGEVVNYSFSLSNTGNVMLYGVTVTDPKVTVAGGPITLAAGAVDSATFSGSYVLTQADIDAGSVYNLALASGQDAQGDAASDSDDHTQSLAQNPAILLEKTGGWVDGDGDGAADVGEVVNYSFSLSNTGNVTLYGVTVTDPKVTVAGGPITLAAGAVDSVTFSGSYVLTQADIDAGSVYNLALASGQDARGDLAQDDDDHTQSLVQNPAILLEKTGAWVDGDGDGAADVGEVVNYSFSLSNTGNVTLYGVTVMDPKVTVAGGPITLAAGAVDSATFSGSYVLTQADIDAGLVYNLALASGQDAQGDLAQDDDEHTQSLIQNPAILLEKTGAWVDGDGDGAADVGEVVNYGFSLSNTGNVTLYGVTVTDPKVTVAGGPITLAAGAVDSATFSGSYVLTQADIDTGSVYNLALASGQDAQGDLAQDDDEHTQSLIQNPAILLEKTGAWVDGDGDGAADVGEVVNYGFSLSNTGNVTLYGVTVTDPKVTVAGRPITLAAGAVDSATFSGSYVLTQADIDAGSVYNLALASGQDAQGDLAQDDDDHTQSLVQNARIDVEKEVSVDGVNWYDADSAPGPLAFEGSPLEFRFKVQNIGNVTLDGVTLTDSDFDLNGAAAGTAVLIGTLAPGAGAFGGQWFSYTAPWQSGQHVNTATASGAWSGGTAIDTDLAHYMGAMPPVVIVGNPQFNFPNDVEKIQPKLQGGGTDQFTLNPDGYISWDLYTPDTAKAWVDTTAGYSSGYSGLTVSIVEVWNSSGTLGTSGAQAIYRIYVANESDNPVQMVNSTNVVVYDIVAASKDKGTVDLINADPLIGNFNSFSNIENAIDKASNGFVTNPPNPYTGTATAEKIWTSASLAGTANAEATVSADGAGGADAIYGRNNDGLGAGDDALRGGAGNDMLEARAGGDAVYGDAGDDRLFGSLGSDILYGGDGMDVLFGGYGADRLSGGAGADKFVVRLSDRDVITDFSRAEGDRIHLWTGPDVTQADLRYEGGVLWADGTPVVQLLGAPDLVVATDVSIGLRP